MTKTSTTSGNDGFSIEVIYEPAADDESLSPSQAVGRIRIGGFAETFQMDLSFWRVEEYRQSWRRALTDLERANEKTTCLISSITDPASSNFISCWPLYRDRDVVHVQNSIIFLDELEGPLDLQEPWRHVQPRYLVDEDGNRISEWVTSLSQVRKFRESAWNL